MNEQRTPTPYELDAVWTSQTPVDPDEVECPDLTEWTLRLVDIEGRQAGAVWLVQANLAIGDPYWAVELCDQLDTISDTSWRAGSMIASTVFPDADVMVTVVIVLGVVVPEGVSEGAVMRAVIPHIARQTEQRTTLPNIVVADASQPWVTSCDMQPVSNGLACLTHGFDPTTATDTVDALRAA